MDGVIFNYGGHKQVSRQPQDSAMCVVTPTPICCWVKNLFLAQSATLTKPIRTGTSKSGPITAANASPELMPNTPMATAIASSKLLLAAVNESVAVSG